MSTFKKPGVGVLDVFQFFLKNNINNDFGDPFDIDTIFGTFVQNHFNCLLCYLS